MNNTELIARLKQTNQFAPNADVTTKDVVAALEAAQPAGEPVGQITEDGFSMLYGHKPLPPGAKLYTHPAPQVPMTDEDILADKTLRYYFGLNGGDGPTSVKGLTIIRAIEAHHKIGVKS